MPSEKLVRPVVIEDFPDLGPAAPTMIPAHLAVLAPFRSLFRGRAALQAELIALRHPLLILERQRVGRRVPLRTSDRLVWAYLSRIWPGWRRAPVLAQPETVLRWHRQGFRLCWRSKSRPRRSRRRARGRLPRGSPPLEREPGSSDREDGAPYQTEWGDTSEGRLLHPDPLRHGV